MKMILKTVMRKMERRLLKVRDILSYKFVGLGYQMKHFLAVSVSLILKVGIRFYSSQCCVVYFSVLYTFNSIFIMSKRSLDWKMFTAPLNRSASNTVFTDQMTSLLVFCVLNI